MVNLFNPKTIKKLCSKIKPTTTQKNAAKSWLFLLEQGKLKKEKLNYFKFGEYILKDLLGYDIKAMSFEEGNIEFSFKDKTGKTILGIEAKGTRTEDLFKEQKGYKISHKTPIDQLWTYVGKLGLEYGIATNYKDFVLINRSYGTSRYHFFDFEEIRNNDEKLQEFIGIFSKEQIIDNQFLIDLEKQSLIEEREFTKQFYKLYHETRLMLIREFEQDLQKTTSVHFAQLFLNRLMFIFFAEDRDLLERRYFVRKILQVLKSDLIDNHSRIVSDKISGVFRALDKEIPKQIRGFNGELFRAPFPAKVFFNDLRRKTFFKDILQYHNLKKEIELFENEKILVDKYKGRLNPIISNILLMSSFDFNTEVNVNILGHIFEQSITDLENIHEKKDKRRKKEGVFYTPEYITDYICRNTIIPYLSKKKVKDVRSLIIEHSKNISELESKIKNLKILDPACGSGAFLLKAVDVLLEITKEIQFFKEDKGEYLAIKKGRKRKKEKTQLTLTKWSEEDEAREIILNSIYGVDLNEESVEITKLSLFLKIAKRNKKLVDLTDNIKCGNSLIDDSEIAGSKAFNWDEKFPFKFDIVIGNPPYVDNRGFNKDTLKYIYSKYISYSASGTDKFKTKKFNTFVGFVEKLNYLLCEGGLNGYILHKNILKTTAYKGIREFILDNFTINHIGDWGADQFEDVVAETITLFLEKSKSSNNTIKIKFFKKDKEVSSNSIKQNFYQKNYDLIFTINLNAQDIALLKKIEKGKERLFDYVNINNGIVTGNDKKYIFKSKEKERYKICITGKDIKRYGIKGHPRFLNYDRKKLMRPRDQSIFDSNEKLIMQMVNIRLVVMYDDNQIYNLGTTYAITKKEEKTCLKYILCLLNSKLMNYYYLKKFTNESSLTNAISTKNLFEFPIKEISNLEEKFFITKADLMISKNNKIHDTTNKFLKLIIHEFGIEKITKKLEKFSELEFDEFMKQLKINISLEKKSQLLDFFEKNKREVTSLKEDINKIETEIDKKIFKIYNLTPREIKIIVEKSK